jgi:hypothetical protein
MLISRTFFGLITAAGVLLGQSSAMAQSSMFPDPALLPRGGGEETARAPIVRSGRLVYNVTINVKSPMPGGAIPTCGAQVFHWGAGSSTYYEYGYAHADRNGSTATCKVTIPYRWDNVATAMKVETRITVFLSKDDIPTLQVPHVRRLNHRLADIALPANGATTNTNFTVDF